MMGGPELPVAAAKVWSDSVSVNGNGQGPQRLSVPLRKLWCQYFGGLEEAISTKLLYTTNDTSRLLLKKLLSRLNVTCT